VTIRNELAYPEKPHLEYSYKGAIAIHQEMNIRGVKQALLPSISTINRVIKEQGLVTPKIKPERSKSGLYYPSILACYPNHRHELDLVTPRYIAGFGKVVSVNRIDAFTSRANLQVYQAKGADNVIDFLVDDWKKSGIPEYLQIDNEASFRGGMYYPKSIGKLIRFCLNFNVQIIFIPWKEPWRNPFIENFNGHFNRQLWLKKRFLDLDHLRVEAQKFLVRHNSYQSYKKKHFSEQRLQSHTAKFLPENFYFNPETLLPITEGKIHFVRLVEENGSVTVLNESFQTSKNLLFDYVWATIDTATEMLNIYHKAGKNEKRLLVKELKYKLREQVCNRVPVKNFCQCQRCPDTKVSTMS